MVGDYRESYGFLDSFDQQSGDHAVPDGSKRWYIKPIAWMFNASMIDCKIIYNQTTRRQVDVAQKAQRSRLRQAKDPKPDPKCPSSVAVTTGEFIQDVWRSGINCLYYDLLNWYDSQEADPQDFEQWDNMSDDEKENENPWDHVMPYISKDQIKMLHSGLPDRLNLTKQRRNEPPELREKRMEQEQQKIEREKKKLAIAAELERYRLVGKQMEDNKRNRNKRKEYSRTKTKK